ncbi:MAG: hypothetical protein M0006_03395 [Magnetospirillum sp.]|nr:hypothetical protein [Magnetospirillum sp.]
MTPAGLFLAAMSWISAAAVVAILGVGIVAALVRRIHHRFNPASRRAP